MDEIHSLTADDKRRTMLRDAVKARLAGVEIAIISTLMGIEQIQEDMREDMRKDGRSVFYLEKDQLLKRMTKSRDKLIAEHAVLEGLLDRYATRLKANVALAIAAGSIILAVINFIRQP